MSRLEQPQRLDLGLFAEACERLKLDQTLTVRVVLDDTVREPLECLVEVMRFHMTHDLALVGIGTELKLNERFVTPGWVKDRYRAVRSSANRYTGPPELFQRSKIASTSHMK
jgi:hypothetical protein